MLLTERIRDDNITISVMRINGAGPASIPDVAWRNSACWWTVTLAMGNRRFTTPYGKGPGHNGEAPTRYEVLSCMLSDAAGLENSRNMADWLADYGYEDDDTASATYRAVERQTAKLHHFLGRQYNAYLWETTDG